MNKEVIKLLEKLDYKFTNKKYLDVALTHSSFLNEHNLDKYLSNERLEFLGDAVLDLIIGEYFFLHDKTLKEGKLSKLRSEVVNEHSLSITANKLNLGKCIKFGKGELNSGGAKRESILADALEALIGAIYLDSDLETTKEIVLKIFIDILNSVENKKHFTDYKSRLQEKFQQQGYDSIEYRLEKEEGPDNNKVFYSNAIINNKIVGKGKGTTKKKSEQLAAKNALLNLGEKDV